MALFRRDPRFRAAKGVARNLRIIAKNSAKQVLVEDAKSLVSLARLNVQRVDIRERMRALEKSGKSAAKLGALDANLRRINEQQSKTIETLGVKQSSGYRQKGFRPHDVLPEGQMEIVRKIINDAAGGIIRDNERRRLFSRRR